MVHAASRSGMHGYAIRVLPRHPEALTRFRPGLITWATQDPSHAEFPAHPARYQEEPEYYEQTR